MAVKFFEDRRPLYQAVADQLSADVQGGIYPVGSMLPTEAELCARFGVSRQTIREATRLLLDVGLVSRQHGVGTRVERSTAASTYVQRLESLPDVWQYVKETRRKVLRISDVAVSRARVPLPGDPSQRWRMLEGLRFVGDETKPIAWTQIFVNPKYAAVTDAKDRESAPIYSLIERHFGIKTLSVRQEISAVVISGDMARLLRVPEGSPGLSMLRQYVSTRDEIFEVALSVHPADRFHYTMKLDLAYGREPVGA